VLLHILVERKVTLICSHPVFNLSRLSIAHARVSIWRRQQDKCRANHRGGLISWACRGALLVPRSLPYDFRAPVSRLSGVVGLVSCLHANSSLGVKRAYSGRKSASSSNAPLSSRDLAKTASTVLVSARRTFASHYCCCERLFACLDRPTLASLQLGTSLSQDLKDMDRCTVSRAPRDKRHTASSASTSASASAGGYMVPYRLRKQYSYQLRELFQAQ
jgi:hypothetical protein